MTKIPVWTEKKLSKAKVVGGGGMPMISVTVLTLTLSIFASRLWLFFFCLQYPILPYFLKGLM